MVVSLGPATETFSMPSLVGLTQEKAEEDITALGLKVGTVTPVYSDTAQAGQVVWQYPEAYKEVEAGSVVSLQVSQGPDPSTQAKDVTKTLSVPLPETGGVAFIQILADGEVVFSDDIDLSLIHIWMRPLPPNCALACFKIRCCWTFICPGFPIFP